MVFPCKTCIMIAGNHTHAHKPTVDSIKFTKLVHIWEVGMSFVALCLCCQYVKGLLHSCCV